MARLNNYNKWINEVSRLVLTNMMTFTIQSKIYSDDVADFIGLSAPVSEVASYVREKTRSVSYFGKGTSIHVNMMSDPEGMRELWDKLMQVAAAINRTEIWDFIYTIRRHKYAKIEESKMDKNDPSKYFDRKKFEWDIIRKERKGMERLCEYVTNSATNFRGFLSHLIAPSTAISQLIFKKEYDQYFRAGPSTAGFKNKTDRPVAVSQDKLDKVDVFNDIKGFKVHLIRKLMSTKFDIYQDVLAHFPQIGSFHCIYPRKDGNYTNPKSFLGRDLSVKIYDEESDNLEEIDYETASLYSLVFNNQDGKIRKIESEGGDLYPSDIQHDSFMKPETKGSKRFVPISLIGEMNPFGSTKDWGKSIKYSAQTMNNHFQRDKFPMTPHLIVEFEHMFRYLEEIPFDMNYFTQLQELNFNVMDGVSGSSAVYQRKDFKYLSQMSNTGFYKLPEHKLPFGAANLWGIEAISKMDTTKIVDNKVEIGVIETARKFVTAMRLHTNSISKQLPECEYLRHPDRYSPTVFQYPKAEYNLFLNGFANTSNFLWFDMKPFSGIFMRPTTNQNFIKFLKHVKSNSAHPQKFGTSTIDVSITLGTDATAYPPGTATTNNDKRVHTYVNAEGTGNAADIANVEVIKSLGEHGYIEPGKYNLRAHYNTQFGLERLNTRFGTTGGRTRFFEHQQLFKYLKGFKEEIIDKPDALYTNITTALRFKIGVEGNGNYRGLNTVKDFVKFVRTNPAGTATILLNGLLRNYELEVAKLKRMFIIWFNAHKLGDSLDISTGTPAEKRVQTTFTLNPSLKKSIAMNGATNQVFGTKYIHYVSALDANNFLLDEVAMNLLDYTGIPKTNFDNMMSYNTTVKEFHPSWPYHIWYNRMLLDSLQAAGRTDFISRVAEGTTMEFGNIMQYTTLPSGRKNIDGTCSYTIYHALYGSHDPFFRSNVITVCLSDCTKENMVSMVRNNACPPVVYLLARPHMEYESHPIIFIGEGAVFRVRGNPLFMMGLHPTTGIMKFRYAQSGGTVVAIEENIYIQENAIIVDSVGGAGTQFYDPLEFIKADRKYYSPEDGIFGYEGEASLFAIEIPLGAVKKLPPNMDITGHYQSLIRESIYPTQRLINAVPHYPTSFRFNSFWKLSSFKSRDEQYDPPNTLICRGRTWYKKPNEEWSDVITSSTFWGDKCTFAGVRKYRSGHSVSPKGDSDYYY